MYIAKEILTEAQTSEESGPHNKSDVGI